MSDLIFVSHATQDKEIVRTLVDELENTGVELWVSYRDIAPGSDWQMAIEETMERATHVLVAVTQACIDSAYVRAEVEFALSDNKIVIPVLLEADVRLPLRWRAVQHVDWTDRSEEAIGRLASSLPRASLGRLQTFLQSSEHEASLVDLLKKYPHWIHPEAMHSKDCGPMAGKSDFFHLVKETGKSSKFFFYLGSPYVPPFKPDGKPAGSIKKILIQAAKDTRPGVRTAELGQNLVYIQVFAGQRSHYNQKMLEERNRLCEMIPQKLISELSPGIQARTRIELEIASYTRLLEKLRRRSGSQ